MKSFRLSNQRSRWDKVLGCGCLLLLGFLFLGVMVGAMMGDYIGPPEGAAENRRAQNVRILASATGLLMLAFAAARLTRRR